MPNKHVTFDHNRDYTPFAHLLDDYERHVGEDDLTHLPEILEKHDYDMDPSCGGREKMRERSLKNLENRCLHHHVFNEDTLRRAFAFAGLDVICFNDLGVNLRIIGSKA